MSRKSRLLPPLGPKKTQAKLEPTAIHDGKNVCGMDPPNHMAPADTSPESTSTRRRWPLVSLLRPVTEKAADAGDKRQNVGVFIDPSHDVDHWTQWDDQPPSWMDPHLLVSLAMCEKEVHKMLESIYAENNLDRSEELSSLLVRVMKERYLPLIQARFEKLAVPYVSTWLLQHYAQQQLDKAQKPVRNGQVKPNQRKSKQSVTSPKQGEPNGPKRSKVSK